MTSESSFGEKIFNCHIGMGSILLLQLSYCHSYKISPQKYEKRTGIDIVTPKFSSSRLFQALKLLVSNNETKSFKA